MRVTGRSHRLRRWRSALVSRTRSGAIGSGSRETSRNWRHGAGRIAFIRTNFAIVLPRTFDANVGWKLLSLHLGTPAHRSRMLCMPSETARNLSKSRAESVEGGVAPLWRHIRSYAFA